MQGNIKLLNTLNSLLADELTAINQYIVHAEMCDNWGYTKLHDSFQKRAITEMQHAEKLIERILFLNGVPDVSILRPIHVANDVSKMLKNDLTLEMAAIETYNVAIKLAGDVNDFATRELLESILQDEDKHINEIEEFQDQISHMTLPLFLTTKI